MGAPQSSRAILDAPERTAALSSALVAGALVLGSAFTVAVYLLPRFDVAYRSIPLHIGVETFGGACGIITAFILLGRSRTALRPDEHALAAAFLVLFVENIFFRAIPSSLAGGGVTSFSAWSSAIARVLEACLLAWAAFSTPRLRQARPHAWLTTVALTALACGVCALSVALVAHRLPLPIDPDLSPVAGTTTLPAGNGVLRGTQIATAALLGLAAWGLARRRELLGGGLLALLPAGLVLAFLAGVNDAVFPSLYSDWVFAGDILQSAWYLAILVGGAREIRL